MRRAVVAALVAAVAISACGPSGTASTATDAPGSPVVGVITAVDSAGLSDVRGFSIRTDDGRSLTFALGPLENATEFPPGHLGEHLASSEPVRVWFRLEGGSMVAYRIEDAAA